RRAVAAMKPPRTGPRSGPTAIRPGGRLAIPPDAQFARTPSQHPRRGKIFLNLPEIVGGGGGADLDQGVPQGARFRLHLGDPRREGAADRPRLRVTANIPLGILARAERGVEGTRDLRSPRRVVGDAEDGIARPRRAGVG